MQTTVKGLIIKEQTIGESDRLVTLLSDEFGLVRAFVRRAQNYKNSNLSATSLFAYGEYKLYRGKDAFVIDNARPIEMFFALRQDLERLALAQYFAQLTYYLGAEEQPSHEMLRLILNALHLLCKGENINLPKLNSYDWVRVTGEIRLEKNKFYASRGPVIYLEKVETAEKPEQPVATFY